MAMNFIIPEYPLNWDDIRREVLELDHHTCQKCGSKSKQLYLHHIIPLSERGSNDAHNLVTLCEECYVKRNITRENFEKYYYESLVIMEDGPQFAYSVSGAVSGRLDTGGYLASPISGPVDLTRAFKAGEIWDHSTQIQTYR